MGFTFFLEEGEEVSWTEAPVGCGFAPSHETTD
jgi:hypothetical protein